MTDLGATIAPKSDQLNADDLINGPITIKVRKVSANPGSAEQPISIYFDGDGEKPYKACKSMRRVLVQVWGRDGASYVGKSMTLYRDPSVKFGGLEVGGIRISHMSDIDKPTTMALTATKAQRKPFTVHPLAADKPREINPIDAFAKLVGAKIAELSGQDLSDWWNSTFEERGRLNIPQDREVKMNDAVVKKAMADA